LPSGGLKDDTAVWCCVISACFNSDKLGLRRRKSY